MICFPWAQEQKKLRTLLSEKEAMPHLKRPGSSFGRACAEPCAANRKRVDAGRPAPSVRSGASSSGSGSGSGSSGAGELLVRPRSSAAGAGAAGHCGEFLKGARRLSGPPFGYAAVPKAGGGGMSSSLALS